MTLPYTVTQWPTIWQELYLERQAIMEVDGKLSRLDAEKQAEADIRELEERTHGPKQIGLELKFK